MHVKQCYMRCTGCFTVMWTQLIYNFQYIYDGLFFSFLKRTAGYSHSTCRLRLVANQWGGFWGDDGCVAHSVLCRQRYPLVHLGFCGGITSCLHLSITWKIQHSWIQSICAEYSALTTDTSEKHRTEYFKLRFLKCVHWWVHWIIKFLLWCLYSKSGGVCFLFLYLCPPG